MQLEVPEQSIQADTVGNAVAPFACLINTARLEAGMKGWRERAVG